MILSLELLLEILYYSNWYLMIFNDLLVNGDGIGVLLHCHFTKSLIFRYFDGVQEHSLRYWSSKVTVQHPSIEQWCKFVFFFKVFQIYLGKSLIFSNETFLIKTSYGVYVTKYSSIHPWNITSNVESTIFIVMMCMNDGEIFVVNIVYMILHHGFYANSELI